MGLRREPTSPECVLLTLPEAGDCDPQEQGLWTHKALWSDHDSPRNDCNIELGITLLFLL